MEDLLQSQIRDSCRLALPEGLRDLMCDISREVLRAQPDDLYKFIVDYLSALLLVRETLPIACRVCTDVCECSCQPELVKELRNIGLEGEDLETAKNVVMDYFDKGKVKEGNLLMKLFNKTSIEEDLLPAIQEAVRKAFVKHQLNQRKEADDIEQSKKAAEHTLWLYEKEHDNDEILDEAATKIQASYRGYTVRRSLEKECSALKEAVKQENVAGRRKPGFSSGRLSSYSLAGSLLSLPQYVPYSAQNITYNILEESEIVHKNYDYTLSNRKDYKTDERKKIMFQETHSTEQRESVSVETECCIEEEIVEDIQSEASSVAENINEDNSFVMINQESFDLTSHENKKRRIETMVDEVIEERQLASTIYGDQKHDVEAIIDEITEENQLALLTGEEKKHEIEIIINEFIDQNAPSSELQETVKQKYITKSEIKEGSINVMEMREEENKIINVNEDNQPINTTTTMNTSDHKVTEEEYDDEPSDDVLNDQEVVDEELIVMSHYYVIEQKRTDTLNSSSEDDINKVIHKPSSHKNINDDVQYEDLEKISNKTIKEKKDSDLNKWFYTSPSLEVSDQEKIKINVLNTSGVLMVREEENIDLKGKPDSEISLPSILKITDPKNQSINGSKSFIGIRLTTSEK